MRAMILKNWMPALLLTGICSGLLACERDDYGPTIPADVASVIGTYNGKMTPFNITPMESDGEAPAAAQVNATMTSDSVLFEDFPIRDLVINALGDETLADQIVAKIGKVNYSMPYTAQMNDYKTGINLTFVPAPLKLTLPNDSESGEPESFEEPSSIKIEVEIVTQGDGVYKFESKNAEFRISAASVTIDGNIYSAFKPVTLAFDLKKQ